MYVVAGANGAGKSTLTRGARDEFGVERYERSIETAADALRTVDHAILFDNSSVGEPFRPIFEIKNGTIVAQVEDLPTWARRLLRRFSSGVRKGNPMP
jgi:predicted ABC-type ATPase